MKRTGFLYDERFLLHRTGPHHPEIPERLEAGVQGRVSKNGLFDRLIRLHAVIAEPRWIEAVHPREYIRRFEEACLMGLSEFDHPDNQICEDTFQTALLAAGGTIEAARQVMEGRLDNAFCAVRPPGHHAEKEKAMGFCMLNNVAIAATYLREAWGVEK